MFSHTERSPLVQQAPSVQVSVRLKSVALGYGAVEENGIVYTHIAPLYRQYTQYIGARNIV